MIRSGIAGTAAVIALAGCGSAAHHAVAKPAECPRATAAAHEVRIEVQPFIGAADKASFQNALITTMGNSGNDTEETKLNDITAARAGAPSSLAAPLDRLAADYRTFEDDFGASDPDPSQVAQAASNAASDASQVQAAC